MILFSAWPFVPVLGLPFSRAVFESMSGWTTTGLSVVDVAAAGTLAYWMAGMSPFDAVNHAFAAVSTGGFSTHAESIGYWDSTAIEMVTLPLMLLGNLSFVTSCHGPPLWSAPYGRETVVCL